MCYECRKQGHFKDECPNLKKEENEKTKKKPTWKGDKKKKAFKATWNDSSESEDNEEEREGASEEVNMCLMAKSSEGEVSLDDISNE